MLGTGSFGPLAAGTCIATAGMLACLRTLPASLVSVWLSFWAFNLLRLASVLRHHFFTGPLVAKPTADDA